VRAEEVTSSSLESIALYFERHEKLPKEYDEITVSDTFYAAMEEAMSATAEDGNESALDLFWTDEFDLDGEVVRGSGFKAPSGYHAYGISFHTHPEPWTFSVRDISGGISTSDHLIIQIVGLESGSYHLLLSTKQSQRLGKGEFKDVDLQLHLAANRMGWSSPEKAEQFVRETAALFNLSFYRWERDRFVLVPPTGTVTDLWFVNDEDMSRITPLEWQYIQAALNEKHGASLVVDGHFGDKSKKALAEAGFTDLETWSFLQLIGEGEVQPPEGSFFVSDIDGLDSGRPEGVQGTLVPRFGDVMKGWWNELEGQGTGDFDYYSEDGTLLGHYVGETMHGLREGIGRWERTSGNVYEGTFRNNVATGHGTWRYNDGDVYEGEVKSSVPHGKGIHYFPNGDYIEGTWEDGVVTNGAYVAGGAPYQIVVHGNGVYGPGQRLN
jgi:hypothetical protein